MSTSTERMRRLRERRAERQATGSLSDLVNLPSGELLERLSLAYRDANVFDFEATAAELAARIRANRAARQAVTVTGRGTA